MYVKHHEKFEIGCDAILNKVYYYYKGQNASHGNIQNVTRLLRHCYHKYDTELVTIKWD